jgi:hypothetical protein
MRKCGFLLTAVCLLLSSPLIARDLGVACELSQDGDWGVSTFQTYEFFDEDDFYAGASTQIRGHDSVYGTDSGLWYFAGWATVDDPDAVWGSEDFPLSVQTGGTDYGYVWAYDDTGHSADYSSPSLTYSKTQCYRS